jgi:hypothetical protein
MAIELTPDVSPESGGFGFQVPVFRMNQGVNAATANPLSRGAMGQPMDMVSESQFGLNPNVLAMADETARQQFYTGVDELNQFVNKAAEFGIDPSKVDMASPESFALNQEFRKRVQALQQQARGITTGAAQQAIVEREANLAFTQQQRARAEEDYLYTKEQRNKADVLERLGGNTFVNEFRILDALSKEGITRGDTSAKNEFMSRAASSVPGLRQAYDQANDQEKKIIKPYLDKALSYSKGEGIVFAPMPQGPKPEKAPAGLDYLAGLAQKGRLEKSVKIAPAYSRVKRFGQTNVISKGAFGLKDKDDRGVVDVVKFEEGFVYLDKNNQPIPVRKSEVGLYPKNIRLMPATLAIGRTKISDPGGDVSISDGKAKSKKGEGTAEVSFVLSEQELETMISEGYSSSEAGMMVKQLLSGGGQPSTQSRGDIEQDLLNQ